MMPATANELQRKDYGNVEVPTFTHTEWTAFTQIIPKGAAIVTLNRLGPGTQELLVGDGIHSYANLPKPNDFVPTSDKLLAALDAGDVARMVSETYVVTEWTPAIAGADTAGEFVYGANNVGQAIKIGSNFVLIQATVHVLETTVQPLGVISISGLADKALGAFPIAAQGIVGSSGRAKNISRGLVNGKVIELYGLDGSSQYSQNKFVVENAGAGLFEFAMAVAEDPLTIHISGLYFIELSPVPAP